MPFRFPVADLRAALHAVADALADTLGQDKSDFVITRLEAVNTRTGARYVGGEPLAGGDYGDRPPEPLGSYAEAICHIALYGCKRLTLTAESFDRLLTELGSRAFMQTDRSVLVQASVGSVRVEGMPRIGGGRSSETSGRSTSGQGIADGAPLTSPPSSRAAEGPIEPRPRKGRRRDARQTKEDATAEVAEGTGAGLPLPAARGGLRRQGAVTGIRRGHNACAASGGGTEDVAGGDLGNRRRKGHK